MDVCHEMSQWAPIMADVTASAEHQMYHGMESRVRAMRAARASSNIADAIAA
jgi:hypothetical protein